MSKPYNYFISDIVYYSRRDTEADSFMRKGKTSYGIKWG